LYYDYTYSKPHTKRTGGEVWSISGAQNHIKVEYIIMHSLWYNAVA